MSDDRTTSRDVPATIVPYGDEITIPEGTAVTITHRLGGNFTVVGPFGMARIGATEADAIGEEITETTGGDDDNHVGPPDVDSCWDALRKVFDPEIPVNIVDLGLIYTLEPKDQGDDNWHIFAAMTLTAPGCGMGPTIAEDARQRLITVPGVKEAHVEIVWDPPWNQDMISEAGKMELGLL